MSVVSLKESQKLNDYLENFRFVESFNLFSVFNNKNKTLVEFCTIEGRQHIKYTNEFWTAKQRQASSLHEVSYRACFKPQLPRFFIELLTSKNDVVYDPFSGRGTTAVEAGLLSRKVIANDANPLSKILAQPRFFVPNVQEVGSRLKKIHFNDNVKAEIDLSMFYHPKTESEVVSLKRYFEKKKTLKTEDTLDSWIKMVATNRLTGHSPGFFSVYTLPPNQAASPASQKKINEKRNQKPEYKNVKNIILEKTKSLIKEVNPLQINNLKKIGEEAVFLTKDARYTNDIASNSVKLTVTSPPFLDIVNYSQDNWLRCWFNGIDDKTVAKNLTICKDINSWSDVMLDVFNELFRITKKDGWVAFEVGEVRNGKINLEEFVVPLGLRAGFSCNGILINKQIFTKTSNIWGVKNNNGGTNSNRIVLFYKN